MTTKVIFRILQGEVIALFPEFPGTNDPATCESYMHFGQHASASADLTGRGTKPATEEQYTPLLKELQSIGYDDLKICTRASRNAYRVRAEAIRACYK